MASQLSASLKNFMKKANDKWTEEAHRAKTESGFERIDDGRYIATLRSATLGESKAGNPHILFEWKVAEGEEKGSIVRDYQNLGNEQSFFFLGKSLMRLGIDPEEVIWDEKQSKDDMYIMNVLDSLSGKNITAKIVLKTNGEFQNVRMEEVIEDYEEDEDDESEATEPESEEVELAVGMKVKFQDEEDELVGVVQKIGAKYVKILSDDNIYSVTASDILEILESEKDD